MDFIHVLFLIAIWSLPIFIFTNNYMKMNKEDREIFINELKEPSNTFGLGVPAIGLLLLLSGTIAGMKPLDHIGAIILIISCFATWIEGWIKKERKFLGNASLMLWGLILTVAYIYLI